MKNKFLSRIRFSSIKPLDSRSPLSYLSLGILILSILLIIINLIFVLKGFYFTGDTISYFDFAAQGRAGNLLRVFIIHSELWPPLTALAFSALRILPVSTYYIHHVYVVSIFLATLFVMHKIAKRYTTDKSIYLAIIAICLFSSAQAYLFRSAIAESLFVLLWLLSVYGLVNFIQTSKERFALLFIASSMALPLARYIGIGVLIFQSIIFSYFIFFKNRELRYKLLISICSVSLIFMPILMFLFKNRIATGVFLRSGDPQFADLGIFSLFLQQNASFFGDMALPLLAIFFLGAQIIWSKDKKIWIMVIVLSLLAYQGFLFSSIIKYRIIENFPSRFISPTYPLTLIAALLTGSYVIYKFSYLKKFAFAGLLITLVLLFKQSLVSAERLSIALSSEYTFVQEPKYSKQVMDLCNIYPGKNRYIFIQGSSRNWVGQSLRYYCSPITQINVDSSEYSIPQDSILFTPYSLENNDLIDVTPDEEPIYPTVYNMGGKAPIRVYQTKKDTTVDVGGIVKNLKLLD